MLKRIIRHFILIGLSAEALAKEDGGKIHREYALGKKRVDLLITFGNQRIVIELKIKRGEKTLDGLQQTAEYMDTNNATEGHLVIFDPASNISWDQKIYYKEEYVNDLLIHVWGM